MCVLLEEKGKLQPPGHEAVQVIVKNTSQKMCFDCWKKSNGMYMVIASFSQNIGAFQQVAVSNEADGVTGDVDTDADSPQDDGDPLLSTLKRVFHHQNFRPGQRNVIETMLSGKDGLVVLPTGGGKTLCFTLPAIISDGKTLVVLPTLSLMQDLQTRLSEVCITVSLSGATSSAEKDRVIENITRQDSAIKVILSTPETLDDARVITALKSACITRIIVDEAHCIDEWGHQFRPSYLALGRIRDTLNVQVVAFTATATKHTCQTIPTQLHFGADSFLLKNSFRRDNLELCIKPKTNIKGAIGDVQRLLKTDLREQSGIIYCLTPEECNTACVSLIDNGITCVVYHGQLSPIEKKNNLTKWLNEDISVIVATKSLGMGIDKGNVRFVIHLSLPSSIPEYFQQIGRAGRDGEPSLCIMYFRFNDRSLHLEHLKNVSNEFEARNASLCLKDMLRLCLKNACLVNSVLAYFDEEVDSLCGKCSVCKSQFDSLDLTKECGHALLVLQGLISVVKNVTFALLLKILRGSREKDILAKALDVKIPLYGCLKKMSVVRVEYMLQCMWIRNILLEESRYLLPGSQSQDVLDKKLTVTIKVQRS